MSFLDKLKKMPTFDRLIMKKKGPWTPLEAAIWQASVSNDAVDVEQATKEMEKLRNGRKDKKAKK